MLTIDNLFVIGKSYHKFDFDRYKRYDEKQK